MVFHFNTIGSLTEIRHMNEKAPHFSIYTQKVCIGISLFFISREVKWVKNLYNFNEECVRKPIIENSPMLIETIPNDFTKDMLVKVLRLFGNILLDLIS